MPVTANQPHRSRLIRRVAGVTGTVPVLMDLQPGWQRAELGHAAAVVHRRSRGLHVLAARPVRRHHPRAWRARSGGPVTLTRPIFFLTKEGEETMTEHRTRTREEWLNSPVGAARRGDVAMSLAGERVVVVGGTSGMGAATVRAARRLGGEGVAAGRAPRAQGGRGVGRSGGRARQPRET